MSLDKQTISAVRQVLMGELGLTREVIREEMRKLIEAETEKVVNILMSQGHIERIVHRHFEDIVEREGSTRFNPSIKELVITAAQKEAAQFVSENIRIGVKDPSEEARGASK